ncbi:MAG TPA: dihydrolipoamide acetyltransferase family protein [candidate division Zixibacteria bacterium]|nr:dihydrolipoamide acetyltransferase family protein [candidate division Zixibacteria bacterium]
MATKILMPQLGESVIEGTVASWLKKEGDRIEQYEPILEIETDKVTTEATAEVPGTLLKILVPVGETVSVGTVLALVGEPGEGLEDVELETPTEIVVEDPIVQEIESVSTIVTPFVRQAGTNGPARPIEQYTGRVSPVVGRIAREHHVDLNLIRGTGRGGRITKKDILAYIEHRPDIRAAYAPVQPVSAPSGPSDSGLVPGEILPLTGIRRAIADHMVMSKRTSPHVTTVFEIDFSSVMAHRTANKDRFAGDGARLTITAYIIAAIAQSLRIHPLVNSRWSDEGIILKKEINVGMATAIPDGLIVPVIKNTDGLSLFGLAMAVNDLSERARNGRLLPDEVQGGTFTLTNHGVSGSLFATPIINQPQCGILGAGKIEKRVKVINDAIAIRPLAYVGLTFDHRILDGATADGFMAAIKDILENWS